MAKQADTEPKRLNRTVAVNDALSGVLDNVLKKRGFATRDILTHWAAMAPKPYDRAAVPEQLKWPRGAGHEGATLYLRCAESHRLGLAHEGALIAAAVNRYFGYFLVRDVRLSAEPFTSTSATSVQAKKPPAEATLTAIKATNAVSDPELKNALKALGEQILSKRHR